MITAARNTLTLQYLPLVGKLARKMRRRLPRCVGIDDLEQVGTIGLMRAAELFDSAKGAKFGTYAGRRVLGAMLDYLRDIDWQPRLSKARGERKHKTLRLTSPGVERDDDWDIADDNAPDPSFDLEQADECDRLTRGLDAIGKQMVLLYFIDVLNMKTAGETMGYSASRVSQKLILARKKMRSKLQPK